MINGWVDVEKDAWIFFIQGNYELAPTLLYLLKTGVPVVEAISFMSQPLVREYVKEQRLGKSTFAEPLGKKSLYASKVKQDAASRVLKKYFGTDIPEKRYYYERNVLSDKYFADKEDKNFTKKEMFDLVKSSDPNLGKAWDRFVEKNKRDPYMYEYESLIKESEAEAFKNASSDLSKVMFLHFLEIEQQISGLTKLKINSNPDTATQSSFAEVEIVESTREDLEEETKIDQELRRGLREDAVISPMYNNDLALALVEPLMPLRYHENVSQWIITNLADFRNNLDDTFGPGKLTQMIDTFRNDMVNMLLQNALRKFNLGPAYKGYNTETEIPVNLVDYLKFGAYVKKNAKGEDTLYIDERQLKEDFRYSLWEKDSEYEGSYEDRGLYPLDGPYFSSNARTNEAAYFAFVAEREYLRSILPVTDVVETREYKKELRDTKMIHPEMSEVEQGRFTYEKILAMRALDNTFNPYKLFQDPENAYTIKYKELMDRDAEVYGGKLKQEYPVLSRLMMDTNSNQTFYNLYVNEKDYDNSLSNLYKKNIADLGNPGVVKVADPEENMMISDFFARLPLISMIQTGLNKTKLNFNNVVPLEQYIDIMREQTEEFMDILEDEEKADNFLDKFFYTFLAANRSKAGIEGGSINSNKGRFKDLFFTNKLENATEKKLKGDEAAKKFLTPTNTEDLYVYSEGNKTPKVYEAMAKYNPDIIFVVNAPRSMMLDRELRFNGQARLANIEDAMSIIFPTSNKSLTDNYTGVKSDKYEVVKAIFEDAIQRIKKEQMYGKPIAFPRSGFGDPSIMPKELFVYLSKRLYEEFGYVNPGSTMYKELVQLITEKQGITDSEIEFNFNEENNPFKCEL
jgi:hypothetical protein